MPVRTRLIASLAALAASACASLPPGQPVVMRPAEAEAVPDFVEQGRIQFTPAGSPGASAAWDGRYVRGPAVNMTLTDEGFWGGTLRGRAVLLRAADGRITGQGVNIFVTQEGAVTHVQGLWFGSMLAIDVSPTKLSAAPTAGVCGIELALADDGFWRGFGGCGGRLSYTWMTLEGVAGSMSREMPQWLFAFLAALPSPQTTVFPDASFALVGPGAGGGGFLPAEFPQPSTWRATGPMCTSLASASGPCLAARCFPMLARAPGLAGGERAVAAGRGAGAGRGGGGGFRNAAASPGAKPARADAGGASRPAAAMATRAGGAVP